MGVVERGGCRAVCGKISEIGNRAKDVKRACRPEKVSGYFVMAAVLIYHQERVLL